MSYSRHVLGWIFFLLLPLHSTLISGDPSCFFPCWTA